MRNSLQATSRVRLARFLIPAICALFFTGCTTIPKNGALLSAQVTEGILRNQAETEKIIAALAATQREILDEKWDDLYVKVEAAYMRRNSVSDPAALTQDDRSSIAANMSKVWEDLSAEISAKETELVAKSRENSAQLVAMNESVQRYLLSVENLDETRSAIAGHVSAIIGLDLQSFGGLADRLLRNFNP